MTKLKTCIGVAAAVFVLSNDTWAVKTVTIDTNENYSGNGQTCCTSCSNVGDVTSGLYNSLLNDGWTGARYTATASWPQDLIEGCNGGSDSSYGDAKLLTIVQGHANANSVEYAYAHNGVCWLNGTDMNLGKRAGAAAGYFVATSCCFLNANNTTPWIYSETQYLWQLMGFHSLSIKDNGMVTSFINATSTNSNTWSWLNNMEDRPGWLTGDNSVIVWSFGPDNNQWLLEDIHYNAKLKGQYRAAPRGTNSACNGVYAQGWLMYELRDHGQDGCL